MVRLVILGGGGHASDVLTVAEALRAAGEPLEVVGLLADAEVDEGRFVGRDVRHLGPVSMLADLDVAYVIAVGYPAGRRAVHEQVAHLERRALALVHPSAVVGAGCTVDPGAVVFDGVHLSAMSRIGPHTCVSYHARVGHDSVIGGFCSLMPGSTVSGRVTVGDDAMIGANAAVLEELTVGAGAVIGAGAAVVRDVPAGVTVVGVPARPVE